MTVRVSSQAGAVTQTWRSRLVFWLMTRLGVFLAVEYRCAARGTPRGEWLQAVAPPIVMLFVDTNDFVEARALLIEAR